ncbi:hypothetical protein [Ktedonobacter sp. SOSP1-85]|uniref:hypothetical protein n=1 Tax=Ktedonobacter sp. SOSP1-85 TaxID=2778367 RepID=UPI001915B548|nr:hypothetical protein [Ktedonobacter sp. SOSP1-85]
MWVKNGFAVFHPHPLTRERRRREGPSQPATTYLIRERRRREGPSQIGCGGRPENVG